MVEGAGDPVERLPGALEAEDGVLETCRSRLDRLALAAPFGDGRVEGGAEMFEADAAERRLAEGGGPGGEERIVGQGRAHGSGAGKLSTSRACRGQDAR